MMPPEGAVVQRKGVDVCKVLGVVPGLPKGCGSVCG